MKINGLSISKAFHFYFSFAKVSHRKVALVMEPSRAIAFCHVPKVASTLWMLVFAKMNELLNETHTGW